MTDTFHGVPIIDAKKRGIPEEHRRTARALAEVGCLIFRGVDVDSVTPRLIELLGRYFRQPPELKERDKRPEVHHQVGWTPAHTETARPRPDKLNWILPESYPHAFTGADPKERFMAPAGPPPTTELFKQFAAPPVLPEGFSEWEELTTAWSAQAMDVMWAVAEMAAEGFGAPRDTFTSLLHGGPHLFAPTGSDLSKYGTPGTALAGWHDDLNLMSVHGKSNFPGLRIWKRSGEPMWVKIPPGCLFVQAGQQFEYLTGGRVLCGMHEVVAVEEMALGIKQAQEQGLVPWRVSTTFFGHTASDHWLEPLEPFATEQNRRLYPRIRAGQQVQDELQRIGLAAA